MVRMSFVLIGELEVSGNLNAKLIFDITPEISKVLQKSAKDFQH